jgi:uncharacterized protein
MLESAQDWLESGAASLDALNVFPVPDGDTGTNMLLTVRAALQALPPVPGTLSAGAASAAMARGAMEGARGNSGIILSQLFTGLASVLEEKELCSAADFTAGVQRAERLARAAISNPTEGTILTVLADVSRALHEQHRGATGSLGETLEAAVAAAAASVERTPSLLPVLREAGVVDAGAKGMLTILEGFLHALDNGRPRDREPAADTPRRSTLPKEPGSFGFCTEFLLAGDSLPLAAIRERLDREGTSVILVGDKKTARVHLHTGRPDAVIEYARSLGTVTRLEVQDLDRQCGAVSLPAGRLAPRTDTTIVSCVDGSGFAAIFRSMGAEVVEPVDPAAGPSPAEILRALAALQSSGVIVLPNSAAAREAAGRAAAPAGVDVRVVPSLSLPEGIAALVEFRFDRDLAQNTAAMTAALAAVRTLEPAGGQGDPTADIEAQLAREDPSFAGVVTVYGGAGAAAGAAERVAAFCRSRFPGATVETVHGGQARAPLVVSLE